MKPETRNYFLKIKKRLDKQFRYAKENFNTARDEECEILKFLRSDLSPVHRRMNTYHKVRNANVKVQRARKRLVEITSEYNFILAILAEAPVEYWQTSKCYEDREGNIHVLLGVYDPNISLANHGHWVMDKDGEIKYTRMPFAPHGAKNFVNNTKPFDQLAHEAAVESEAEAEDETILSPYSDEIDALLSSELVLPINPL